MNLYHYHSNPEQLIGYDQRLTAVPVLAYRYANSIKKRFPEGEDAIASDPGYAYEYAREIIDGRWPKGEHAIAKDPYYAYRYAKRVIGGGWPKGEDAIASRPRTAYWYAKSVIEERFPKGEAAIKNSEYWPQYKKKFVK